MGNVELDYRDLLKKILQVGTTREDRTGIGSKSIFNQDLKWDLSTGKFPLITARRMYPKVFKTEFDWFINGETNIKRFQDNNVTIWDAWADDNGDLGPVYGHQMLNFNDQGVDQLKRLIYALKTDPDSRRHIISLWNPAQIHQMALPPCYLYFQFFVEHDHQGMKKLNMFVVQRSGDVFLGIPYDMALFSQMLLYVATEAGMIAQQVHMNIIDAHIYDNQVNAVHKYLAQVPTTPPDYTYLDKELKVLNYQPGPRITCPVAV